MNKGIIFKSVKIFLLGIIITMLTSFPERAEAYSIVINEINFNPSSVDDSDGEFIELYNASSNTILLDDYSFIGITVDFTGVTLSLGEFLVLAREPVDSGDKDTDSFESVYGDGDGDLDEFEFTILDFSGSLHNKGETLSLIDNMKTVVDTYNYSVFVGTGADGGGFTVERINPFGPSIDSNFGVSTIPGGTPGNINSIVPEPSSALLFVSGLAGLVGFKKWQKIKRLIK
jgi:hypothetical protein